MRIGIFFGGSSREREVSFAGGRTVFDNLDKNLFEAVPIFVDSLGQFILLDWQYIYKGTIRDFYPPAEFDEQSKHPFQIYIESLDASREKLDQVIEKVGKRIQAEDFKKYFDFAFLALHGPQGEDGAIQGLLEWYHIPYSGSGLLPSSIGINKIVQKTLFQNGQSNHPNYTILKRENWDNSVDQQALFESILEKTGENIVVKAPHQGSSIGVTILKKADFSGFEKAMEKALFRDRISIKDWQAKSEDQKVRFINTIADIRTGIGFPMQCADKHISHPQELYDFLEKSEKDLLLESLISEDEILIESFIEGEEFSCIVIEDENGKPIALPPTQIIKPSDIFDYRAKYLPGISRKITPINLPDEQIIKIRKACEELFISLDCDVYARLDGFISEKGIYLNDPNTTSGMLPSSFFFHQAAEIGLNPSQFLTFIIRTSLRARLKTGKYPLNYYSELENLDKSIQSQNQVAEEKEHVAVIMGGFSSERHISVESGRNIYEKLSSSKDHLPFPVFLTGNSEKHELYEIPINIMLKDNADDIRDKILNFKIHPLIEEIRNDCVAITEKYTGGHIREPKKLSYDDLAGKCDSVFIALHGRPGEDGTVQKELVKRGIPYNGSQPESSKITINKFETNEKLRKSGFLVADHEFALKKDWMHDADSFYSNIESRFKYPFIAKPADDGCSSAVTKINDRSMLEAYSGLMFRDEENLNEQNCDVLGIHYKEEFPRKDGFVIETLINKGNADHFLEITGGLLTHFDENGNTVIEMFEPSEALATGDVLSLEEKFLAGEGQNITPARYSKDRIKNESIGKKVKEVLKSVAETLDIQGYARIDAFVRIFEPEEVEVFIIEINSLPGMTPATCIFHQSAINNYTPLSFISGILDYGKKRSMRNSIKNEN